MIDRMIARALVGCAVGVWACAPTNADDASGGVVHESAIVAGHEIPRRGVSPAMIDIVGLRDLAMGARVGIVLRIGDEDLALDIERFEVLAAPGAVVIGTADGDLGLDPDVLLLRGEIVGEAGSRVFIGHSAAGLHGIVVRGNGHTLTLSTGPADGGGGLYAIDLGDAEFEADVAFVCGTVADDAVSAPPATNKWSARGDPECRIVRLAVDTDWEFTSILFAGDTQAAAGYALTLIAAVGEIYRAEFNTRFQITFLRVWPRNTDPYNYVTGSYLPQFRTHWRNNMAGVPRDLAHLLSGRFDSTIGGQGLINGICDPLRGFSFSALLRGSFPYPLVDNNSSNWDVYVVAHELGHNFGSVHTHEMNPIIDGCGLGDCSQASQGTLMSYCQICPGVMANIVLTFGPTIRQVILDTLDALPCSLASTPAVAVADTARTFGTNPVLIDVLLNDAVASCDPPGSVNIASFDAATLMGGQVTLIPADGSFPRDRLLYTPSPLAPTGSDAFNYRVVGSSTPAIVSVTLAPMRAPDLVGETAPGVHADYYELAAPTAMPDFAQLTPYGEAILSSVNFGDWTGAFAGSGRADDVGIVFEGVLTVPATDLYLLYSYSSDGSMIYVGDELVVYNDGVHTSTERGGEIGLQAGTHRVRVEFFEATGSAAMVMSWKRPGTPRAIIPSSAWSHEIETCPADWDASGGTPDSSDFLAYLNSYSANEARADLAPPGGDGVLNSSDFLAYLNLFVLGC